MREAGHAIGYTTMQTRLNRLVEKGLANRTSQRPGRYSAVVTRKDVSANHLEQLVDRVTQGSIVPLVAHLVDDNSLTVDELRELKKIVREAEKRIKEAGDA